MDEYGAASPYRNNVAPRTFRLRITNDYFYKYGFHWQDTHKDLMNLDLHTFMFSIQESY